MSATENKSRNGLITVIIAALCMAIPSALLAQSSPLTIQPSTGRVGIGITQPSEKLDVSGNVKANQFIGDGSQLTNLPGGGGGSAALDKVTANTTVVNNAAETNLYSFSVPGGTLGTNNMLRLTIQIIDFDIRDGNNCVLRFKYGGTVLGSITLDNGSEGDLANVKAVLSFVIAGDVATNAQLGSTRLDFDGGSGTYFLWSSGSTSSRLVTGTSAADSTVAQTLTVTADWSLAHAGNSITLGQAILEKIS